MLGSLCVSIEIPKASQCVNKRDRQRQARPISYRLFNHRKGERMETTIFAFSGTKWALGVGKYFFTFFTPISSKLLSADWRPPCSGHREDRKRGKRTRRERGPRAESRGSGGRCKIISVRAFVCRVELQTQMRYPHMKNS